MQTNDVTQIAKLKTKFEEFLKGKQHKDEYDQFQKDVLQVFTLFL